MQRKLPQKKAPKAIRESLGAAYYYKPHLREEIDFDIDSEAGLYDEELDGPVEDDFEELMGPVEESDMDFSDILNDTQFDNNRSYYDVLDDLHHDEDEEEIRRALDSDDFEGGDDENFDEDFDYLDNDDDDYYN
jgi:hypothetical protein